MEPGSKAERLGLNFPATANYPKAIDQLKERFEREDLLVQIYVRDLLTLVMKNAAIGRVKADLPLLYDELETACLRKCWSPGKEAKSSNRIRGIPFFRAVDELSSARGERRGDGSFGTDWPHPPPESTKKDYHANTGKQGRNDDSSSFSKYGQPRWWEGPLWLRESPEYWPLGETPGDSEEVELERKKLKSGKY
ncbi:uncharacterized protein TNCV_2575001 [Trichonephila clavipes]|nr:uncharacterized protein TNCV_2575001 [Trichonephila clavipes]